MSQATAGVTFDLTWQIEQWRAQAQAFQSDLTQMAEQAQNTPINIPVTIDIVGLENQVDAAIAEIEATRSINIPVNAGSLPWSQGDSIDLDPNQIPGGVGGFTGGVFGRPFVTRNWTDYNLAERSGEQEFSEGELSQLAGGTVEEEGEEGAAAARGAGGGRGLGAFMGLMLLRRAVSEYDENSALNAKIDQTGGTDVGVAGGESQNTKTAKEALGALETEKNSFSGEAMQWINDNPYKSSLIEGPLGPLLQYTGANQWVGKELGVDFDFDKRESDLKSALQSSEQTDEKQKKVEQENRAEDRFQKEADSIGDRPEVGANKYDQARDEISSKYGKLGEALVDDYEATRQTAEDLNRFREAYQQLGQERFAAMAKVTEAEQAHAQELADRDNIERAHLSGDSSAAAKAELQSSVDQEFQSRGGESSPDAVKWRQGIGQQIITQGSAEIDESQRFGQQQAISGLEGQALSQEARNSGDTFGAQQTENDAQTRQRALDIQEKIDTLVEKSGNNRSEDTQKEIDALETELSLTERIGAERDQAIGKARAQHEGDLDTDIKATEARAHGGDRQADLYELENKIKKEIADASPEDQAKMRQLGSAQIDQFLHADSHPFMGSEDQYLQQLQMGILKGGANVDAQAKQFQDDINHPKKTEDAADMLHKAAEAVAEAAKKFAGIWVMEAIG